MFQTFRLQQPTPLTTERPVIGASRAGRYLPGSERNGYARRTQAYGRTYGRRAPAIETPTPIFTATPALSTIAPAEQTSGSQDVAKLDHAA